MRKNLKRLSVGLLVCTVVGLSGCNAAQASAASRSQRRSCWAPRPGYAECNAHIVTNAGSGQPLVSATASGLTPADLHAAYNLGSLPAKGSNFAWNGQTVAIVDANDNPKAAADLVAYRKRFNLPLCATVTAKPTTDNLVGCLFTKVNQDGQVSPLPRGNTGWGQEINLDVDMVAATCPSCKILLVEARSNSFGSLAAAVDRAADMGVNAISNSYGGDEFLSEGTSAYDGHYDHPGIAITVSAGDSGYGAEFPAASQYVTAVGGTSLAKDTSDRGWTESVWNGSGSGCSKYIAQPSWQSTVGTCSKRVVADVSAVADPSTGVAVYDSYGSSSGGNWYVAGGTSAASPIIAGVFGLAGNAGDSSSDITYGEFAYQDNSNFFDVTKGSNGKCTTKGNSANLALCTGIPGFDGPTGLGTPNGTDGF